MRYISFALSITIHSLVMALVASEKGTEKDTLICVAKNPDKGFCNDYILFIPKPNYPEKIFIK